MGERVFEVEVEVVSFFRRGGGQRHRQHQGRHLPSLFLNEKILLTSLGTFSIGGRNSSVGGDVASSWSKRGTYSLAPGLRGVGMEFACAMVSVLFLFFFVFVL